MKKKAKASAGHSFGSVQKIRITLGFARCAADIAERLERYGLNAGHANRLAAISRRAQTLVSRSAECAAGGCVLSMKELPALRPRLNALRDEFEAECARLAGLMSDRQPAPESLMRAGHCDLISIQML